MRIDLSSGFAGALLGGRAIDVGKTNARGSRPFSSLWFCPTEGKESMPFPLYGDRKLHFGAVGRRNGHK
jgi:hypothetical protein